MCLASRSDGVMATPTNRSVWLWRALTPLCLTVHVGKSPVKHLTSLFIQRVGQSVVLFVLCCWRCDFVLFSDVKKEKDRQSLLGEVEKGADLKKVETSEKNPLPDNDGKKKNSEIHILTKLWPLRAKIEAAETNCQWYSNLARRKLFSTHFFHVGPME